MSRRLDARIFNAEGPVMSAKLLNCALLAGLSLFAAAPAFADDADQAFALHEQATVVVQGHDAFTSPYRGPQSLDPAARGNETSDVTLYAGVRPWAGAELWINPEIDQGFGLSDTLGVAGFPSGEAYKVGARDPYLKLPRLFLRQTVELGGDKQSTDADLNVLGGSHTADRLVITVGKFGVPDVFDQNGYAHDPRQDFLNWTLIDTGSFDYAADAWGFTYGAAAEWYKGPWTLRAGWFDLSNVPNSATLDGTFQQYQWIAEAERRYSLGGLAGKIAVTGFDTHGRVAEFTDAVALADATGLPADAAAVRRMRDRAGISLNLEQSITADLGAFVRAGIADGRYESYEYTDVDRTFAFGLSQGGKRWGREGDTLGAAVVVNGASSQRLAYLAAGGAGILVGDGQLPHPGDETSFETYYSLQLVKGLHATLDYQFVDNPGYNRDRGPVSVLAIRLHAQY
jgi:high affinity Mn2+ porin